MGEKYFENSAVGRMIPKDVHTLISGMYECVKFMAKRTW
jgi:hypothetical protein